MVGRIVCLEKMSYGGWKAGMMSGRGGIKGGMGGCVCEVFVRGGVTVICRVV